MLSLTMWALCRGHEPLATWEQRTETLAWEDALVARLRTAREAGPLMALSWSG
jgi:hypothetical protein